MALFDDEETTRRHPSPGAVVLGEDLERYGREELAERISLLRAEIARIEAAIAGKTSQQSAAESLFKSASEDTETDTGSGT